MAADVLGSYPRTPEAGVLRYGHWRPGSERLVGCVSCSVTRPCVFGDLFFPINLLALLCWACRKFPWGPGVQWEADS